MVKIDLITGFLGSGKTTFIRQYAQALMRRGENIAVLENDYGAVNVDMMLLQDLMGEKCELEMVSGGCDADCHRRRFKTKLISMGMCGYDRVIVEPSGLFDADEFYDVLYEEPLDSWYSIGNVIAVADARMETGLSDQARRILAGEIAGAGMVILSKIQNASEEDVSRTTGLLNAVLEEAGCRRKLTGDIIALPWNDLTERDWDRITSCGWHTSYVQRAPLSSGGSFSSIYYMNGSFTEEKMQASVKEIFADTACGHVFRIKGFLKKPDQSWLELNATRESVTLQPITAGQEIVIVIGEDLKREVIDRYMGAVSVGSEV